MSNEIAPTPGLPTPPKQTPNTAPQTNEPAKPIAVPDVSKEKPAHVPNLEPLPTSAWTQQHAHNAWLGRRS